MNIISLKTVFGSSEDENETILPLTLFLIIMGMIYDASIQNTTGVQGDKLKI